MLLVDWDDVPCVDMLLLIGLSKDVVRVLQEMITDLCLVLSLTADAVPTSLLSKIGDDGVLTKFPFIIQSEESSTGRKKVGKVKKHPELSLIKLQPLSHRKQRTDNNGLRRFGT
jgi:hypothetical protein